MAINWRYVGAMTWAGKPHPVEAVAEWAAPLILACAAAWSAALAGLPLVAKVGCGVIGLAAGFVAMRMAGVAPVADGTEFDAVEFEFSDDDDVLLLEDRLIEPDADSRVVQLFARAEPTPGELVLKISDYLNEQGRPAGAELSAVDQQVDASAALHAALANIRANLR
ncbi:hypothetical protein LZ518_05045 [Sphingomonas sp. RB56-2]|uniref:Uncharacterized protein n=1 Tax=Sphingomonas brevis TaxID=2908206 RepID=A0ABT0S8S5_9SPHN|nr:hypothetical protein [Sphingomonas brevis]MCL6740496.1 hypothetical protein [Sphingomonas brevis]